MPKPSRSVTMVARQPPSRRQQLVSFMLRRQPRVSDFGSLSS
jgi:hypothetical protein